jgi:hypothetical protein
LIVARPETAGPVGKCHIGDARIQHLHEGGHRYHNRNQPRAELGPSHGGGCRRNHTRRVAGWRFAATFRAVCHTLKDGDSIMTVPLQAWDAFSAKLDSDIGQFFGIWRWLA